MKLIEFIKRNISAFNIVAILAFIFSIYNIIILKPANDYHGMASVVFYGFLFFSLVLFLIDFLMKKIIIDKSNLIVVQIILLFVMFLFIGLLFS